MMTFFSMSEKDSYHEHLLHWIWKSLQFNLSNLNTACGKNIKIFEPGTSNNSDGPDFLNACLQIGKLKWYGDVEIHWRENDWDNHGHQTDPNYDRVVLHVVYEPIDQPRSSRTDGSPLPTLCLKPHLMHSLQFFLEQSKKSSGLPCKKQVTYISEQAFKIQIEKAHREYFEQKVDELMVFYNSSLPLSEAWKHMLAIALFDGLGIAHNREPMRKLAKRLLKKFPGYSSPKVVIAHAHSISGLNKQQSVTSFGWNHKGCRPNNHPSVRISQGAKLLWGLQQISLSDIIHKDISHTWNRLHARTGPIAGPGEQRRSI
jgi:hypothetical protein